MYLCAKMFNSYSFMKKFAFLLSLAVLLMPVVPASAKEPQQETVVFIVTPVMTSRNCENKIKTNIRFEKGVNDIATDVKNNTVTIKYNAKSTDVDKLIAAFKKIGYEAKQYNADSK